MNNSKITCSQCGKLSILPKHFTGTNKTFKCGRCVPNVSQSSRPCQNPQRNCPNGADGWNRYCGQCVKDPTTLRLNCTTCNRDYPLMNGIHHYNGSYSRCVECNVKLDVGLIPERVFNQSRGTILWN